MSFPEIKRAKIHFIKYPINTWVADNQSLITERRSRATWARKLVKELNEHLDGCPSGYDSEKRELCPICPVIRELLKQVNIDRLNEGERKNEEFDL